MQNIRRGAWPAAARAKGAYIDPKSGSASATAAPRRKRRREIGRRVDANGVVNVEPVCGFIVGLPYFLRNNSLSTIARTIL
jgi:hypothetical protein